MVGLVLELALELAQLPHRLLEAVVLQRDRGVGGERLEQPQVGVGEVAHDAGAVGQQHRADDARLAREHREHRVRDAALLEVAAQAQAARRGGDARDGLVVVDQRQQLVGDRGLDRRHDVARVARAVGGAQRRVALGGEQHDLRDLGAERLDRAREQALEGADDLGRARERAGRLVEELEALVALALGGVGAVGEEDGDERDDEQRQRARVVGDDDSAGEAEARVGGGDREVHQEHAPERLRPDQALGQRDRRADQRHRDERGHLGGDQREHPRRGPEALDRAGEEAEEDHGQARRERELGDVEDDLDRRQAAIEEHHDDRPSAEEQVKTKKPKAKVKYRFSSTTAGATFECSLGEEEQGRRLRALHLAREQQGEGGQARVRGRAPSPEGSPTRRRQPTPSRSSARSAASGLPWSTPTRAEPPLEPEPESPAPRPAREGGADRPRRARRRAGGRPGADRRRPAHRRGLRDDDRDEHLHRDGRRRPRSRPAR